ncbi:MAG: tRNA-queuosine alpha-mannosyltransferase domain-containing protein [Alkalispirochaetaceae bacterium]
MPAPCTKSKVLSILFLEPFYGGSHRAFADGLSRHSAWEIEVRHLPDRHWKWRMHGAALTFAEGIENDHVRGRRWDLIVATSLLDVTDLRSLLSRFMRVPPLLFYVHETQFDYPLSPGEGRDAQYGFRNLLSILSSDLTLFNSSSHRRRFFQEAKQFLSRLPKPVPANLIRRARAGSRVLYPGIDVFEGAPVPREKPAGYASPLILWNHRWEHDKDPESFFRVLFDLDRPELSWRLAVVGEEYSKAPVIFDEARERLAGRILRFGYCENRREYLELLGRADIVASTARQENFGLSVAEAILAGAVPLLPYRLSYPELLPRETHATLLYNGRAQMRAKLELMIEDPDSYAEARDVARDALWRYRWERQAPRFDRLMKRMVQGDGSGTD